MVWGRSRPDMLPRRVDVAPLCPPARCRSSSAAALAATPLLEVAGYEGHDERLLPLASLHAHPLSATAALATAPPVLKALVSA